MKRQNFFFFLALSFFWSLWAQEGVVLFQNATRIAATELDPNLIEEFELNFGCTLTSVGDLNADGHDELAIGAWGANEFSGRVYILFLSTSSTTNLESFVTISSPNPAPGERFGYSVTNIGDLTGDGINEIAIGAVGNTFLNQTVQTVYIYSLSSSGQATLLSSSSGEPLGVLRYGHTLTLLPDMNSDGIPDLAIGAPGGGEESTPGCVVIAFLGSDSSITGTSIIGNGQGGFVGTIQPNERFGYSLTTIDDFDGNGIIELVVGTPRDSEFSEEAGALYILFLGPLGVVVSQTKILPTMVEIFPRRFGSSLSSGDLNGDGLSDLLVGISFNNDVSVLLLGNQSGAVDIPQTSRVSRPQTSNQVCSGVDNCETTALLARSGSNFPLVVLGCSRESVTGSIYIFQPSLCGNGIRSASEACDDGNQIAGDGCSLTCDIELGFRCNITAGLPDTCFTVCGDSIVAGPEFCDDGNSIAGDGCSEDCAVENGFECLSQCATRCGDNIVAGNEECEPGLDGNCTPSCQQDNRLNMAGLISGIVLGISCILCLIVIIAVMSFLVVARKKAARANSIFQVFEGVPILDNVEVHEVIGQGHFGKVYSGSWNGVDIALKSLSDPSDASLQHEMGLMVNFRHPNVLGLFGLYLYEDTPMMATELMERGDLLQLLHSDPELGQADFFLFSKQIASGMAYIHSQNILHRDLACRNVLVSGEAPRFTCKVSDFGLSRITQEYYQSNDKTIPVRWTAPEVIEFGKVSKGSDVWSYAVVLFEIFSRGGIPYAGWPNRKVIEKVRSGFRLPPPEMPDVLSQIYSKAMSASLDIRPTFVEINSDLDVRRETVFSQSTTSAIAQSSSSHYKATPSQHSGPTDSDDHYTKDPTQLYDDKQTNLKFRKFQEENQESNHYQNSDL